MKKTFSLLTGAGLLGCMAFTSCDSVSEPDRFIEVDKINAKRVVLIEEFTGQRCTNCPDGHQAIRNIIDAYPESVVAVSINASNLAIPEASGGLMTPTGEEYYKSYGSPALPTAVINRNSAPLQIDNWASTVAGILSRETPLELSVEASLANDNQTLNIEVEMEGSQDITGNLQVWVCENDIVGYQLDHGVSDFQYVHNHVFRAAVNGTWGQAVNLEAYKTSRVSLTQQMGEKWNPENVYAVAFVYDSNGVIQAAQSISNGHGADHSVRK